MLSQSRKTRRLVVMNSLFPIRGRRLTLPCYKCLADDGGACIAGSNPTLAATQTESRHV